MVAFFTAAPASAQRMPQDSWYLAKEFSAGGVGKFNYPQDVAVGPDGNLYVADSNNNQIQVLDADGLFLRSWNGSSAGVPNNSSFYPNAVAVAADGKVFVSDGSNHRVLVFDAQGKFLRSMGQNGSAAGQLSNPTGIAVDASGNVYVGDTGNYRITVFDADGAYVRHWGGYGEGDDKFYDIGDIHIVAGNKLAVSDYNRIRVFNADGTLDSKTDWISGYKMSVDAVGNYYLPSWGGMIRKYSSSGALLQEFNLEGKIGNQAYGLAVSDDKIYLTDYSNHRINIIDTSGNFIAARGTRGSSNDASAYGLATDSLGNIYLADFDMGEIRKYDANHQLLKKFGTQGSGDGQFNGLRELAIGANQKLYALDQNNNRVQIFDLEGNFLVKFGSSGPGNGQFSVPYGLAVGKDNKVYVADKDNHRVQIFDANGNFLSKFGTQGSFDGQFQSPYDVAAFPNGDVAVADYGNKRVQIFDHEGNFLRKRNYYDLAREGLPGIGGDSSDRNRPEFVFTTQDGLLGVSAMTYHQRESYNGQKWIYEYRYSYPVVLSDSQLNGIKAWMPAGALSNKYIYSDNEQYHYNNNNLAGPMAESKSGDLIVANGDRKVRVWKRTFRTVHPEPSNAIPLPAILSQGRRPGSSLVDVEYRVKDADDATVQTAALAFKNGGNSLSDVIPITSLAEGTGNKLGANIATGQTHRFTWNVAGDWNTDFAEVQLEVLAKDNRGLINLDFLRIPAGGGNPELKISRSPVNDNDFLSVWYWLLATGDPAIRFEDGKVKTLDGSEGKISGLIAEYFENADFSGTRLERIDAVPYSTYYVNDYFYGVPFTVRAIRWTGEFVPKKTGAYNVYCSLDGQCKVVVAGSMVIDQRSSQGFVIDAQAGVPVPIIFEIRAGLESWNSTHRYFSLSITPPGEGSRSAQNGDFQNTQDWLSFGNSTTRLGRDFIFQRMGLREATAAEVMRAKEAGTPGVINQWEPKLKVGPGERPAKVNAYGFDTGADGYWVVPVSGN
jgi:DNA-binding beta-propeller fold protein YncE